MIKLFNDFKDKVTNFDVKKYFQNNFHLYLCFFIPVLILFTSYAFFGVFPFGDNSLLSLDLNAQYIYYYDYIHDVLAGNESLFYSWSRNLSGEMMGIIGYYLASPFMLFLYLFPREMITEGLLTMVLAKIGASGLFFGIYLSKRKKMQKLTVIVFSIAYALNSFFVVQTMNPMWLDSVLFLPLLVLGIEELCENRKFKLFILALVYCFVTNFYIGYMMGFFSAIYFLYYINIMPQTKGEKNDPLKTMGLFGVSAACSTLISAFIILPVYKSLSMGKFTFSNPDYTVKENFNLLDLFGKLLPNSYDTVRMEGMPFLFVGSLVLIMAIVYFMNKRFSLMERISSGILLTVIVISMYIKPVDMIWHGGQVPNWLPYRYSFLISFVLAILAAQMFEHIKDVPRKHIGIATITVIGVAIYLDSLDDKKLDGITVILPAILAVVVFACVLVAIQKPTIKKTLPVFLVILVSGEMLYNTYFSLVKMNADIVYSSRPSYNDFIQPTREVVTRIREADDTFYRMEKIFRRNVNDPIALRMYGVSHSSSTLNEKAINFLNKMGYVSRSHNSKYEGATPLTDDLFGFKYLLAKDEKEHINASYNAILKLSDFSTVKQNQKDITVYENPNVLPMLYLSSTDIKDWTLSEDDPFENQNKLISALIGDGQQYSVFKRITSVTNTTTNLNRSSTTDAHDSYSKVNKEALARLEYFVTAPSEQHEVFMFIRSTYERNVDVDVSSSGGTDRDFNYENYSIRSIGTFEPDADITVKLTLKDENLYVKGAYFYYLDEDLLDTLVEKLHKQNDFTKVERVSGDHLKLSVNAQKDSVIFSTIPAEEGWSIYVDGVEQSILTLADETLIGIPVSADEHKIEMKFFPAGLKIGLVLTFTGIGLFIFLIVLERINKKRKELVVLTDNFFDRSDVEALFDNIDETTSNEPKDE